MANQRADQHRHAARRVLLDRLFAYGTLTEPDVFEAVTGIRFIRVEDGRIPEHHPFAVKARLDGFQAKRFDGKYLYAVPREGATVQGWLIHRLSPDLFTRLDHYEGPAYRRIEALVTVGDRRVLAYVYAAAHHASLPPVL